MIFVLKTNDLLKKRRKNGESARAINWHNKKDKVFGDRLISEKGRKWPRAAIWETLL